MAKKRRKKIKYAGSPRKARMHQNLQATRDFGKEELCLEDLLDLFSELPVSYHTLFLDLIKHKQVLKEQNSSLRAINRELRRTNGSLIAKLSPSVRITGNDNEIVLGKKDNHVRIHLALQDLRKGLETNDTLKSRAKKRLLKILNAAIDDAAKGQINKVSEKLRKLMRLSELSEPFIAQIKETVTGLF